MKSKIALIALVIMSAALNAETRSTGATESLSSLSPCLTNSVPSAFSAAGHSSVEAAAPVVAETLLADGTTNTWTQADLVAALGLLNRRYRRDIETESGRRAWHGREVTQTLLTNDTGKLVMRKTYADGFTFDKAARRQTAQQVASNMAARVRASLPTNGVSPRVASLRTRAADAAETAEITVRVDATHDYPAKVMAHEIRQYDDYGNVTNRVPDGRTEYWIEAGGRIRCVRYDATNGVVKTYYRQRPMPTKPAPLGKSINAAQGEVAE